MTTRKFSGSLLGTDTIDTCEFWQTGGFYTYSIRVSGGGNVHLKVEYYTGDQPVLPADSIKGSWKTIEERIKIESGHTTEGSFTLPAYTNEDGSESAFTMKIKFSRGVLTKGAYYHFEMNG